MSPGPLDTTTERATLIDVLVGYLEADCPTSVQRVDVESWHALNPAFESSGTVSGLATKNVLRLKRPTASGRLAERSSARLPNPQLVCGGNVGRAPVVANYRSRSSRYQER